MACVASQVEASHLLIMKHCGLAMGLASWKSLLRTQRPSQAPRVSRSQVFPSKSNITDTLASALTKTTPMPEHSNARNIGTKNNATHPCATIACATAMSHWLSRLSRPSAATSYCDNRRLAVLIGGGAACTCGASGCGQSVRMRACRPAHRLHIDCTCQCKHALHTFLLWRNPLSPRCELRSNCGAAAVIVLPGKVPMQDVGPLISIHLALQAGGHRPGASASSRAGEPEAFPRTKLAQHPPGPPDSLPATEQSWVDIRSRRAPSLRDRRRFRGVKGFGSGPVRSFQWSVPSGPFGWPGGGHRSSTLDLPRIQSARLGRQHLLDPRASSPVPKFM